MSIDFSDPHFHHSIIKQSIWNQCYEVTLQLMNDKYNPHLKEEMSQRMDWLFANKGKAPYWYRGPNWQDWVEPDPMKDGEKE